MTGGQNVQSPVGVEKLALLKNRLSRGIENVHQNRERRL
jgi:hypothetical protein